MLSTCKEYDIQQICVSCGFRDMVFATLSLPLARSLLLASMSNRTVD